MTKFRAINSRKLSQKIQIKKQKQLKYEYLYGEDEIISELNPKQFLGVRQRIPSKQQYRRIRTESMKSETSQCSSKRAYPANFVKTNNVKEARKVVHEIDTKSSGSDEDVCVAKLPRISKISCSSGSTLLTPPQSANFKINPLWFEDVDHLKFVGQHDDINYHKVLKEFGEYDECMDETTETTTNEIEEDRMGDTEELVKELNDQSKWILDLSETRTIHAKESLESIQKQISIKLDRIFNWALDNNDEEEEKWHRLCFEFNKNYVMTEAMVYLMRDLTLMDWENLHEQSMKWAEINTEFTELTAIIKKIDRSSVWNYYLDENLKLLSIQLMECLDKDQSQTEIKIVIGEIQKLADRTIKELKELNVIVNKFGLNNRGLKEDILRVITNQCDKILENFELSYQIELLEVVSGHLKMDIDLSKVKCKMNEKSTNTPNITSNNSNQNKMRTPLRLMMILMISLMYMFGNNCDVDADNQTTVNNATNNHSNNTNSIIEALLTQSFLSQITNQFN